MIMNMFGVGITCLLIRLQLDAGSSFSQSDIFDVEEPFSSEVQKRDLMPPPAGDSERCVVFYLVL